MTSVVYLNGSFVSDSEARISVFDGAFLHGAGLFETMRAVNGRVFRLDRHVDRLQRSAAKLIAPMESASLPSADDLEQLLKRNSLLTGRVRLTVSAGSMRDDANADAPRLTVCVSAAPMVERPDRQYEQGVGVVVCSFQLSPTDPLAGHKSTAYLPRLLGLREARQAKCFESLWFTTGRQLAEGSISNAFVVHNQVIRTPPLDTPVLPGIAREAVLEIAPRCGYSVEETPLTIDDLLDAHEVFVTNVIMGIVPVIRVEKHDIADGRVGAVTQRMRDEFQKLIQSECGGT